MDSAQFGQMLKGDFEKLYIQSDGPFSRYHLDNQTKENTFIYSLDSTSVISRGVIKRWNKSVQNVSSMHLKFFQLKTPNGRLYTGVRLLNSQSAKWELFLINSYNGSLEHVKDACSCQQRSRLVYRDLKERFGVCVEVVNVDTKEDQKKSLEVLYPAFIPGPFNLSPGGINQYRNEIIQAVQHREQVFISAPYCLTLRGPSPSITTFHIHPPNVTVQSASAPIAGFSMRSALAVIDIEAQRRMWVTRILQDFNTEVLANYHEVLLLQEVKDSIHNIVNGRSLTMTFQDMLWSFGSTLTSNQKASIDKVKLFHITNPLLHESFLHSCSTLNAAYALSNVIVDNETTLGFFAVRETSYKTWLEVASQGLRSDQGTCTSFGSDGILVYEKSSDALTHLPQAGPFQRSVIACLMFHGRSRSAAFGARFASNDESFMIANAKNPAQIEAYYVRENLVTPVCVINF